LLREVITATAGDEKATQPGGFFVARARLDR
jgi:hypothetical protein